jgi:hypothetical protein
VTENLSILEIEVKDARAKFAKDLALLRSRELSADLKSEARSLFQRMLDNLKARAAANPSAALAIGAGIGWRLLKHPPIATVLVGAGILSLWRTKAIAVSDDYLGTAHQRFGEQLNEAAATLKDYAAETAVAVRDKTAAYARSGRKNAEELATSAVDQAAEALESVREAGVNISHRAVSAGQRATSESGQTISDDQRRDQVLFGMAGLAVMAALSIAYQRRISDELRASE